MSWNLLNVSLTIGQLSTLSKIPSWSESLSSVYGGMSGHPSSSSNPLCLSGSEGHASSKSNIPSESESLRVVDADGIESGHPS